MPSVVLIVSIPDICLLPYFLYSHEYGLTRNTVYCAILSDQIVVGCQFGVPISYYFVYITSNYFRQILSQLLTSSNQRSSYKVKCIRISIILLFHALNLLIFYQVISFSFKFYCILLR